MKITVALKRNDSEGYLKLTPVAVFSDYNKACEYYNKIDPEEELYDLEEFEVDKLIID